MEAVRTILFWIAGVISIIVQLIGEIIIATLLGILCGGNSYLWGILFLTLYYLVMYWKHKHYAKLGHKCTGLTRMELNKNESRNRF